MLIMEELEAVGRVNNLRGFLFKESGV